MTDIDRDIETARKGHVGYSRAQADEAGADWLHDHPPYCAGCLALDRIKAELDRLRAGNDAGTWCEGERLRLAEELTHLRENVRFYAAKAERLENAAVAADEMDDEHLLRAERAEAELAKEPDISRVTDAERAEALRVRENLE